MPTTQLAAEVGVWIERWERDHPDLAARQGGRRSPSRRNGKGQLAGNQSVAAITILQERTQLADPEGIGVPKPTIESVVAARWRTTELRTADMLVAAIERPEAWHDGTLTVIPNPNATVDARASCCGGSESLNGSLA